MPDTKPAPITDAIDLCLFICEGLPTGDTMNEAGYADAEGQRVKTIRAAFEEIRRLERERVLGILSETIRRLVK